VGGSRGGLGADAVETVRWLERALEIKRRTLRVEVGYSRIIALWKWNEFMACALDDGKGD
jgi:hypothetical protein